MCDAAAGEMTHRIGDMTHSHVHRSIRSAHSLLIMCDAAESGNLYNACKIEELIFIIKMMFR
jgi:hypothetical protein